MEDKNFILFGGAPEGAPPFIVYGAGGIELVTGALIAIGLFTAPAAFLASGTMAVAYVQFHWTGELDASFFPAVNRGEPALLYAFLFLHIACRGAGPWSVEGRRAPRT